MRRTESSEARLTQAVGFLNLSVKRTETGSVLAPPRGCRRDHLQMKVK